MSSRNTFQKQTGRVNPGARKKKPESGETAIAKKSSRRKKATSEKTPAQKKATTAQARRSGPPDKNAPRLLVQIVDAIGIAFAQTLGSEIIPELGELKIDPPQDDSPAGTAVVLSFVHYGYGRDGRHMGMTRLHVSRQDAAKIGRMVRKSK